MWPDASHDRSAAEGLCLVLRSLVLKQVLHMGPQETLQVSPSSSCRDVRSVQLHAALWAVGDAGMAGRGAELH